MKRIVLYRIILNRSVISLIRYFVAVVRVFALLFALSCAFFGDIRSLYIAAILWVSYYSETVGPEVYCEEDEDIVARVNGLELALVRYK